MLVTDIVSRQLSGGAIVSAPREEAPIVSQYHPRSYYDAIVQRDIFNSVKAAEPVAQPPVVASDLRIKLLGTSQLTLSKPFAIIEDERNQQALYQLGDDIPGAGKLVAVEKSRVIINHNGQNVALELPVDQMNAPVRANPIAAALPRVHTEEGIRREGDNQFVVDRRAVDQNLQNMASLFTQMRAIPNLENGKPNGFRLSEIQPGSLFQQMGLLDGDVIKGVGGQELSDPSKAMELLTLMRNQSNISIDLIRGGRPVELNFEIR
jgi:general secretion pathway protein C